MVSDARGIWDKLREEDQVWLAAIDFGVKLTTVPYSLVRKDLIYLGDYSLTDLGRQVVEAGKAGETNASTPKSSESGSQAKSYTPSVETPQTPDLVQIVTVAEVDAKRLWETGLLMDGDVEIVTIKPGETEAYRLVYDHSHSDVTGEWMLYYVPPNPAPNPAPFKMHQQVKIVKLNTGRYLGVDKLVGTIGEIINIDEDDEPPYIVGFASGGGWPFYADEIEAYVDTPSDAPPTVSLQARVSDQLKVALREIWKLSIFELTVSSRLEIAAAGEKIQKIIEPLLKEIGVE